LYLPFSSLVRTILQSWSLGSFSRVIKQRLMSLLGPNLFVLGASLSCSWLWLLLFEQQHKKQNVLYLLWKRGVNKENLISWTINETWQLAQGETVRRIEKKAVAALIFDRPFPKVPTWPK